MYVIIFKVHMNTFPSCHAQPPLPILTPTTMELKNEIKHHYKNEIIYQLIIYHHHYQCCYYYYYLISDIPALFSIRNKHELKHTGFDLCQK